MRRLFIFAALLLGATSLFGQTFTNIQTSNSGWSQCTGSCAGGGVPTSFTFTPGSPATLAIIGPAGSSGLQTWKQSGPSPTTYFNTVFTETLSTTNIFAFEFDQFKFVSGQEYMFGHQCDFTNGFFDVWDQLDGVWVPTTLACSIGTSQHIISTSDHICGTNMCYDSITIDGVTTSWNLVEPSGPNATFADAIGSQFQLDINGSGTSATVTLNNVTFTASDLWSGLLNPLDASFPGASTTTPDPYGINWSMVGVGGIPARLTTCATISSTGSDQSAAIQSALTACPSGQTVLLNPGTFQIASHVTVPSNVTLRGSGPNLTILNATGTSGAAPVIQGGGGISKPGTFITCTAGCNVPGSTSITLSSLGATAVGNYLMVTEPNNSVWVNPVGIEGTNGADDGWGDGAVYARGQLVEVESISGTTVKISPGLYGTYVNGPVVVPFAMTTKFSGVENLQIFGNNTNVGSGQPGGLIYKSLCAYCWTKGVEYNYANGNPEEIDWGYRDEIRDSYISNSYTHGPGSTDAAIFIVLKTSASLVENNILERTHVSIMLNWGAAGNVIAYNYSMGNYDTGAPNITMSSINHHGAHPQFNLFEGNVGGQMYLDDVWGSNSHDTSFRDWMFGIFNICTPSTATGSSTRQAVTLPCNYSSQVNTAIQVSSFSNGSGSYYHNFVGTIVGSTQTNAHTSPLTTFKVSPANRGNYDGNGNGFSFGYGEPGDSTGYCSAPSSSCKTNATALQHGIYSGFDGTTTWFGSLTHTLPPSFYLNKQPSWWTAGIPFPANGPDVSGSTVTGNPGGHAYGNPAMHCYLAVMGGSDGGVGGPLSFNPSNCYGASSASTGNVSGSVVMKGVLFK